MRLVRYRRREVVLTPGSYTDWFGIKTRISYFTTEANTLDQHIPRFVFPDDGIHAESIEYLGTAKALEGSDDSVTVIEMGAGYAPWLVFSAHVAKRLGKKKIKLVAVEAEAARHELIRSHFQDNGIPLPGEDGPVTTEIVHGAISNQRGSLTFGSASIHDWGGALQEGDGDYRGIQTRQEVVPAMLMSDVLKDYAVVDLLHVDIQGWESKSIEASLDDICAKVRYMLIGTHSRSIEGDLITMLRRRGWKLMHEKPCQFNIEADLEDLSGATWLDGAQIWANAQLGADPNPPVVLDSEDMRIAGQERNKLKASPIEEYAAKILELEQEIVALKESRSWRITAPLRRLRSVAK